MTKPFCRYTRNQIRFEYDKVQPCCWINKKESVSNVTELYQWFRKNDSWENLCQHCIALENKKLASPRTNAEIFSERVLSAHQDELDHITSLEFQIDGDCNAACIMCSEVNSSTWTKYNQNNGATDAAFKKFVDIRVQSNFLNRLRTAMSVVDLSNIKQVTFIGGEPLLNDNHLKVLDTVLQQVPIENIKLKYITNASKLPDQKTLELWAKAKRVTLIFSVDGIGRRFEHNRWPLQWKQVSENIEKLVEMNMPNMKFGFSVTLTPFTVYYAQEVEQWIQQLNQKYPNTPDIEIPDVFGHASTGLVNLSCVPNKLRSMIIDRYGYKHRVSKLVPNFDQESYDKFMQYITYHDQKRQLNWREIYSEIQHCFD